MWRRIIWSSIPDFFRAGRRIVGPQIPGMGHPDDDETPSARPPALGRM
jgi:hypothetical protein